MIENLLCTGLLPRHCEAILFRRHCEAVRPKQSPAHVEIAFAEIASDFVSRRRNDDFSIVISFCPMENCRTLAMTRKNAKCTTLNHID